MADRPILEDAGIPRWNDAVVRRAIGRSRPLGIEISGGRRDLPHHSLLVAAHAPLSFPRRALADDIVDREPESRRGC